MKPHWRQTFLAWSELPDYAERIEAARENIRASMRSHRKGYCSYSGGKDSSVLVHLCLSVDPEMLVFHWKYSPWQLPKPFEDTVLRNLDLLGVKNKLIETSPQYDDCDRELPAQIFNRCLFGRIEPMLIDMGYDLCFLGLRAEESLKRKRRTATGWDKPGKIPTHHPLKDLVWQDVWAYTVSNGLPYLDWYDQQEAVGRGYNRSRFGTLFMTGTGSAEVDAVLLPQFLHSDR